MRASAIHEFRDGYACKANLTRELAIDNGEAERAHRAAQEYLLGALGHFRVSLSLATGAPTGSQLRTMFRVISLWLHNDADGLVNAEMARMVRDVPS